MSAQMTELVTGYTYNGVTRTFPRTATVADVLRVLQTQDATFSDPSKYTATVVGGVLQLANRTGNKA